MTGPGGLGAAGAAEGWHLARDHEVVHELLLASDRAVAARYGLPVPVRNPESTRRLTGAGAVQALHRDGRLVATVTITATPPFAPDPGVFPAARLPRYLQRLAVCPDWLSAEPLTGVQCLQRALEVAAAQGADAIRAQTNPDLQAMVALLRAFGFSQCGPVFTGGPLRRIYLQKNLTVADRIPEP